MEAKIASEEKKPKFPHSNSQQAADTGFTNGEGGNQTEIAYSLREEKVINQGYAAVAKMQHTMKQDI